MEPAPPTVEAVPLLAPDVRANMELAWAKLSMQRLVASHERRVAAATGVEAAIAAARSPYPSQEHFPHFLL